MSEELHKDYLDEIELPEAIKKEIEEVSREMKLNKEDIKKLEKEVKKSYLSCRFEPGEAVGIISAQSISEPATQMSLPYEEKILIRENEILYPIEIGKFVDTLMDKFGFRTEKNSEILDLPEFLAFYVYSIDEDEKIRLKKIKSVIRHKSPKKLLEIRTSSGRKIIATDHHSFVIRKNNQIIPVSGKLLKINDRIPVIRRLPENCLFTIPVNNLIPSTELIRRNGYVYPYIVHSKGLPEKLKLDFLLGWFIGAYLAEGNCTKNFVSISNINENFNSLVRRFTKKFNLSINEYDNFRGFSKGHDIHINSTLLSRILSETFGNNSRNKRIPYFVFSANKEFVSGLLQAYFDGDGNITVEKNGIRVSSESKELIDGIALLLTRFGIFCSKSNNGKRIWIPYKYAKIFYEEIGSSIKERKKLLKELSKKYSKTEKRAEINDMIPGIGDILFKICKKLKFPTRYINNFTKKQRIGRSTLQKYIKLFKKLAKERNTDISEEIKILEKAFNSDVVWDRIEKISYIPCKSKYVYDISVDGLETFTTFEGIITHNTMRTYHFAGSAGIKITYGLPRLIEIFDAKKQVETPSMTLFLKKEFNNMDIAKRVAESIVEQNIESLVKEVSINLNENTIEIEPRDLRQVSKIEKRIKENMKDVRVRIRKKSIVVEPKSKVTFKDLQKLKVKLLQLHVDGIKDIKNAVVRREGDEWIITTIGSNLKEVFDIKEIDSSRSFTNDIYETAKILGIEAARNLIIEEALKTMQEQGLDVDVRHITLVADIMTLTGELRPIGRYGVAGSKASILSRAAFEETIKHLVRASLKNETDEFLGIFENVMVGQVVPCGTGMFEVVAKFEEASS